MAEEPSVDDENGASHKSKRDLHDDTLQTQFMYDHQERRVRCLRCNVHFGRPGVDVLYECIRSHIRFRNCTNIVGRRIGLTRLAEILNRERRLHRSRHGKGTKNTPQSKPSRGGQNGRVKSEIRTPGRPRRHGPGVLRKFEDYFQYNMQELQVKCLRCFGYRIGTPGDEVRYSLIRSHIRKQKCFPHDLTGLTDLCKEFNEKRLEALQNRTDFMEQLDDDGSLESYYSDAVAHGVSRLQSHFEYDSKHMQARCKSCRRRLGVQGKRVTENMIERHARKRGCYDGTLLGLSALVDSFDRKRRRLQQPL